MTTNEPFDLAFTSRVVSAWGGLALLKRMLVALVFKAALGGMQLPPPGSNRGYAPEQLIEPMIVSIGCGAARFAHADITRLDSTLTRLFGWGRAAGHKAIVRLFQRFDQGSATRVQSSGYRWLFEKLKLNAIALDVDSRVITRWGSQIEGAAKGYKPKQHGRASHPPLLAFVADWRLVANFWLRPGNVSSLNNALGFLEETLCNLGATALGLFRADSGFYDKGIVAFLRSRKINYLISAKLTQALQLAIVNQCKWLHVAPGLEVSELQYTPQGWGESVGPQRLVVVRQHMKRKPGGVPGKTMSLFADDPDLQGWRYGAIATDLSLPAVETWRVYRGRAHCENRIKALNMDFGLGSFALRELWATEAALGVTMLAYKLMSVFRHAVMRQRVHHTLATLHHKVLAVAAFWDNPKIKPEIPTLRLAVTRQRRRWFEGLWADASEPVNLNSG